jgi:hypothetical protein
MRGVPVERRKQDTAPPTRFLSLLARSDSGLPGAFQRRHADGCFSIIPAARAVPRPALSASLVFGTRMLVPREKRVSPAVLLLRQKEAVTRQRGVHPSCGLRRRRSWQRVRRFAGAAGSGPKRSSGMTSRRTRATVAPSMLVGAVSSSGAWECGSLGTRLRGEAPDEVVCRL